MHRLRKFYNDNKGTIWKTIGIIAFIFIIIQLINYMTKANNEKRNTANSIQNSNNNISTNINNENSSTNTNTYIENKSATTGQELNTNTLKVVNSIIENFVDACNNGEIEKAYNLLTTSCKEELYPNLEQFKNSYVAINFDGNKKVANIENWIGNTYKVTYKEDIMETGEVTSINKQDYITIFQEEGVNKLNISSFISDEEIKKSNTQYGITITAINKKVFMDYEEYTINVQNKSGNKILLDTLKSTKTMYLQNDNKIKFYARSHELTDKLLEINNGFTNQIKIKFIKTYSSSNKVNSLVFSDLVLNYNNYINGNTEKQEFTLFL